MKFNEGLEQVNTSIVENSERPPEQNVKLGENIVESNIKTNEVYKIPKYFSVPLTEEEMKLTGKELGEKYNVSKDSAYLFKKTGIRTAENPNYIKQKDGERIKKEELTKFLNEITPLEISSLETVFGNKQEQDKINEIATMFDQYKYHNDPGKRDLIYSKKFKLLNGQELNFGDFFVLNKIVKSKMFRNQNGELMVFDNLKNEFIPFRPNSFLGNNRGFHYKNAFTRKDNKNRHIVPGLDVMAPNIYKMGFFKEEDFGKRLAGTPVFEVYGPHERKISNNNPYVSISNSAGFASYYIGRDKFTGTDKKINHDTVKISLLDDNTGVVTDTINGRKIILYTFPLLNKEEYQNLKDEVTQRKINDNSYAHSRITDFIKAKAELKEYSILDYIEKRPDESEKDYIEKISRLSDTSYVLGNFRSFMSETGLAANNYSWTEQLVLADALTSVENKDKIVKFGKSFKKDGLRTFLSVEQGGKEIGGKIIGLGEKLPEEVAKKVFAKYGEIVDTADNVEKEIKNIYKKEEIPVSIFNSIKETLLKEGVNLLLSTANIVSSGKEINEQSILEELEKVKTDTIILGESYIELYKEGIKVPIEEITRIEKISTQNLTIDEKKELLKVYENGRPKETYENKEHVELLKKEFEETLNKKDTFVFNIRFNGRIIAFATLDQENIDTLHIGGLTFIDDVRNPAVGVAVMNAVMKEFGNFNIKALVHSENKILPMYQKRYGFKIVGELPREENAGELYYEIERPKNVKEEKTIGKMEEFEKAA